ncbi:MAG TPA: glycosyltransferase family 4 protein [Rudaea sp.]
MGGWSLPLDSSSLARLVAAFLISACATWASIRYAQRRRLIDHPGQRRLHRVPTPRGGGIGIVLAVIACFVLPLFAVPAERSFAFAFGLAFVLVAIVGWIDDHRSLSARLRIIVHFAAAPPLLLLIPLFAEIGRFPSSIQTIPGVLLAIVVTLALATIIVWSVNLHNFMDGIDGLLACQAIFVFAALGFVCAYAGDGTAAGALFVFASAVLGFLPFNFPRARIFMGDVGSGAIGLMVVVACAFALAHGGLFSGIIACSAFVTDASCNLLSRMWRGRRWYSAHREHLYQWMTRTGLSHAQVVGWYMGWNLLVVAPVLVWVNAPHARVDWYEDGILAALADRGSGAALTLYAVAVALWIFGKRWCLRKVKSRALHAPA